MSIEQSILDTVIGLLENSPKVEKVILDNLANKYGIVPSVNKIIVRKEHRPKVELDNQHCKTDVVIKSAISGANIALVGPAGSGKTTIASSIAKALNLEFYSKSVSAQTGMYEFFGYMEATGKYVPTLFRKAYEKGGVFLVDEFDAGNPNVLASLNQATANGSCAFPDGMVKKHKDFICVMAGNTYGTGANAEYVGRNKIDAATLDRFVFIEIDYDEKLETSLAINKEWCKYVQKVRAKANKNNVKCIISPRATFVGESLLANGVDIEEVKKMVIYKGLSSAEIDLLKV